mmetsp:Transcript_35787/g.47239  ORF Transcript_35787/g.47239 Transcript_35787/m.47239 type:complete len:228 (-) Transcript_35787:553-1236(-)|eukprot:CAMPEP_0117759376 /NCGR_PEP_ID=MMETSP0947-20121206/15975_1 /TAXON_ID=44440 /ORGANISM="Chattonella subsalsa, Strain CCMP2191" /LENGTH=227 /DNA_ID=CAMNT_0005579819 /DNA_START=83 /DNA_END=766 /DNA_ORIENTATION=-
MKLMIVVLLVCFTAISAFVNINTSPKFHNSNNVVLFEKQKYSLMDVLSGKAQVAAEKKASPSLYKQSTRETVKIPRNFKINENAEAAIGCFRKKYPNPRKGGTKDVPDNELAYYFYELSKITNDEARTLEMVKAVPFVLTLDPKKNKANFEVFENTYGTEKALGLITRNPGILAVPTTGYGSAEVAGDDAIVMSYIIAFTRPAGAPLLLGLVGLLLTPFIKQQLGIN